MGRRRGRRGITGLSTAVLLGRAGMSVLVLEARQVGVGTTGGSTAKISLLQGTQLTQVARHHSSSVLGDYVRANRAAQALLGDFCAARDVGAQHRPAFTYATTAAGEHDARTELRHAQEAGLPAAWVDEVALPFRTRGALTLADQQQVDPVALLHALREEAVEHGAAIIEGARVTGVHGHRPVRVVTDAGGA